MEKEFKDWMEDGNVEMIGEDTYIEQTTQWRKKFTMSELIRFYLKEFQVDAEVTDLTELTQITKVQLSNTSVEQSETIYQTITTIYLE